MTVRNESRSRTALSLSENEPVSCKHYLGFHCPPLPHHCKWAKDPLASGINRRRLQPNNSRNTVRAFNVPIGADSDLDRNRSMRRFLRIESRAPFWRQIPICHDVSLSRRLLTFSFTIQHIRARDEKRNRPEVIFFHRDSGQIHRKSR